MKYFHYFLCAGVVLAVVLSLYFGGAPKNQEPQLGDNQSQEQQVDETPTKKWETKTNEESSVTIESTPLELGQEAKTWKFNVVLDTHSVDLSQDMVEVSFLSDNQGNVYQPTAWEGPPPGGHHLEGVLVFDAIEPTPSSVNLVIKDIGGTPERLFEWGI